MVSRRGPVYSLGEWDALMDATAVPRSLVRELVRDFFVREGFVESAKALDREASRQSPGSDLGCAAQRNKVRDALVEGRFEEAIALVEAAAPGMLQGNDRLHFRIRKHLLVAKILAGDVAGAVAFAQEELAPLTEGDATLRQELEQALSLLVFEEPATSPLAHLLDKEHVLRTARELNGAILQHKGLDPEPRLVRLLQTAQWTRDKLDEVDECVFPHILRRLEGRSGDKAAASNP